ncbi:MAG: acyltransferase [unclassified Hahellaceae]|nr:acyltransferase [Hahellaceae bacterium]
MSQHLKYMPHIDGLRAVAVLSVLLFHLDLSWIRGGFVGVDVFFVISGFLITALIKREIESSNRLDFKRFYIRRFWRLAPAFLTVLAFTTLGAVLLLSPMHLERYGASVVSALLSLSNIYFFTEGGYFDFAAQLKPLLHTWSLSIEEQFYLLWPVTMLLCFKAGLMRWMPALLALLTAFSLYLNVVFSDGQTALIDAMFTRLEPFTDGKNTIFFLLPFRIFEFAIGAGLVWAINIRVRQQIVVDAIFWFGLAALAACFYRYREWMLFPSFFGVVPCIAAAMIIYAGGEARGRQVLTNPFALWFGLISYSLYLVHWPLIVFTKYVQAHAELSMFAVIVLGLASIVLGWLLHKFVETPWRFGFGAYDDKAQAGGLHRRLRLLPLASLAVLGVAGLSMSLSKGWSWRIDTSIGSEYVAYGSAFPKAFTGGAGFANSGQVVSLENIPDIIIMGDSHARHYINGLQEIIAEPAGLSLYAAANDSCLHLPGFTRKSAGMDWDRACPGGLREALDYVEQAKQAGKTPVVILSQFWLFQIAFADRLTAEGEKAGRQIDLADVREGLLELKSMLGDAELIVIGNVPGTAQVDIMDQLTRPALSRTMAKPDTLFTTPIEDGRLKREWQFNKSLEAFASKSQSFTFLNPFGALCQQGRCVTVVDRRHPVYSDSHHLSQYGSRLVIKKFAPVIRRVIANNFPEAFRTSSVQHLR